MPTALIVDDSPLDRVLVDGLLKRDRGLRVASATDGVDALAKIGDVAPDVVITDLQMPEMDGLQLVTALRIHYPDVPVVLITAHGSEDLALQALEHGAASYVPKSQLNSKLLESVQRVLALSQADRSYQRLTACMDFADFRFWLQNDQPLQQRLVELVQQIAVSMGLCDVGGQVRLGMALEEALSYMLLRGNLELSDEQLQQVSLHDEQGTRIVEQRRSQTPYAGRRLRVTCRIEPIEARLTIAHEGSPMPVPQFPAAGTPPELEAASNRSLVLMSAFLDEVQFNETGTEVTLVKRRGE